MIKEKVMPGVQLGEDLVVASGALVTMSFPSQVILEGVPARQV